MAMSGDESNQNNEHRKEEISAQNDLEGQIVIIRTYKTRFWILFIFSVLAFYQCMLWNTWGPISASMEAAFPKWGPSTVALLSNWGCVALVLGLCPVSWLCSEMGLRDPVVGCAGLIALGTSLRCFSTHPTVFLFMSHLCAIMVSTAGAFVMCIAAMVPAVWFPPNERTTAIAVIIAVNQLGVTGSYLQPLMVHEPGPTVSNEQIKGEVMNLMFIEAGIAVSLLIVIVAYFPDRPRIPPSISSTKERLEFLHAFKEMIRNKDLLLVFLSFALACVIPFAWVGVLNFSLGGLGISQEQSIGIGIAMAFGQVVSSTLAGRLTDMIYGRLKETIMFFIVATCLSGYWFGLLTWGTIPNVTWQIYASIVGIFCFSFAAMPLFIEYAVEIAYPCPEQVVLAIMYTIISSLTFVFLVTFASVHQGTYDWMVYILLATNGLSLFPLLAAKDKYARSNVDKEIE